MKTEYVRELRENYLQITGINCNDYGMKMLAGQEIQGFLNMTERKINGESRFLYKISSLISMEDNFLNKNITYSDFESIIRSFLDVFEAIENHLMDYNGIILDPEMIFLDISTKKWYFVYLAGEEKSFYEDIKSLFEYIIKNVNHKDSRAVTMAYGIYKRMCEENFNPRDLFDIETTEKEEGEIIKEQKVIETVIPEVVPEEVEELDMKKIYISYGVIGLYGIAVLYTFMSIFFTRIRVWGWGSGVYVVLLIMLAALGYFGYNWYIKNKSLFVKLSTKEVQVPFVKENVRVIVPRENGEEENLTVLLQEDDKGHTLKWREEAGEKSYDINSMVTIVGSAFDRADCVISQKGISRIHARITSEGDKYFIKDMNSTNGTRVNGRELACYELCELKSNDRIELGNLECIFI